MLNETVEYKLRYAGVLTRTFGAVVDLYVFQFLLAGMVSLVDLSILNLILFLLYFGVVPFLFGGTLGQKLFGMSLVDTLHTKVKLWRALFRSLLLLGTFWWFFYVVYHWDEYVDTTSYIEIILPFIIALLPLIIAFFNTKHQTLFDKLSGTCVVVREKVIITPEGDQRPKRGLLEWGRLLLKVSLAAFMAYVFYVFAVLMFGYGIMYFNQKKNYNKSFHQIYTLNDHNDSRIRFYVKELERPSKEFVEAEGMYDILAADVKRDLAGNCISYFLRLHKEDDWINVTSNFRKNARNRYANTKEDIAHTKENESYLGKHFYDYDLNDVNEIEDGIVNIWGDENSNIETCQNLLSVDEMYQQFIMRYIQNREEALLSDQKSMKRAKPKGTLSRGFYKGEIDQTQRWLKMLYTKHPEYREYEKEQKILQRKEKQQALWKRLKKNIYYPEGYFKGVDANILDENGKTPLMLAVESGKLPDMERLFLESDVDFHIKDKEGRDVYEQLRKRIQKGSREAQHVHNALRVLETKKALQGKAKIVGYTYKNAEDILSIVINKGKCENFDLPERTSCAVAIKKKKKKWDPIFDAIYHKDNDKLERLLAEGGHVNVKNGYGHSPLFYATPKYPHALKRLIESGADMYDLGKFGNSTPLMSAVRQNDTQSVKIFLEHGMDVNFKHPRGNRVLDVAVQQCKQKEMITLLRSYGAKFLTMDEVKLKRYCKDADLFAEMKKLLNPQ